MRCWGLKGLIGKVFWSTSLSLLIPVWALCAPPAAEVLPQLFEVSVGSAHSTPVRDIGRYADDTRVVPYTSVFFLGEYFVEPNFRIALAYDLPTTTAVRFVGDEKVEEIVSSRAFAGLVAAPFRFPIRGRSILELQGAALLGVPLGANPGVLPLFMGRLHASQDARSGVGGYLGFRYLVRVDELSVFYGVGYRF